jgi:hypothetical protein
MGYIIGFKYSAGCNFFRRALVSRLWFKCRSGVDHMERSECTLATIGVPAIMFGRRVKHYRHWLPVRSGLNNQLLVQQVSSELLFLNSIIRYIFYYNNFDRKGPRGADVYILLNVATECSRNYAKNIQLFTCYSNMTSSFPRSMFLL